MSALSRRINITVTLSKLTQKEIKEFIVVFMKKYHHDFQENDAKRVYRALETSPSEAGEFDKFTIDWVKRRLTAAITETVYEQEHRQRRKRPCQEHRQTCQEAPSFSTEDANVFLQKVAHPGIR